VLNEPAFSFVDFEAGGGDSGAMVDRPAASSSDSFSAAGRASPEESCDLFFALPVNKA
jgi:hypothetical protein